MCSELDLLLSDAENAAGAPPGAPRTIERSPRNLIGEARAAFDAGARELTGIAATGGKDHPTARLSGPCPGKVWHRAQELAGRARKRLACGGANRDARSLSKGQQERHRLAFSKDATSVLVGWAEPGYRGRGELPERCSGRGTSRSCPRPTGVS